MTQLRLFPREPAGAVRPLTRGSDCLPVPATTTDEPLLRRLRAWVYEHPGHDASAIADFMHLRRDTVLWALGELRARGLVRVGGNPVLRYGERYFPAVETVDLSTWEGAA